MASCILLLDFPAAVALSGIIAVKKKNRKRCKERTEENESGKTVEV
jgi:hypothetical protein